jgi:hypothetical protein
MAAKRMGSWSFSNIIVDADDGSSEGKVATTVGAREGDFVGAIVTIGAIVAVGAAWDLVEAKTIAVKVEYFILTDDILVLEVGRI